jgi:hypothetical protein
MFEFANPLYLVGLGGAAVPVLIHLLTRDRVRRVQFSTLRFFLKGSKRVLRRKRLRELLLLLLRAAVCALLAVAFARPFFEEDEAGFRARRARAIVIDTSASMSWPNMKAFMTDEAKRVLDGLDAGADAACLITFSDLPAIQVPLTRSLGKVADKLDDVSPGHGGTNIVEALVKADEELRRVKSADKRVILISDLQASGWPGEGGPKLFPLERLKTLKLMSGATLEVRRAAPGGEKPNVAIVQADYPESAAAGAGARPIRVQLRQFRPEGAEAGEPVSVDVVLEVEGAEAAREKAVRVPAEGGVPVALHHDFGTEGENRVVVKVVTNDAIQADNEFRFSTVVTARKVAILTPGRPAAGGDEAFFVVKALSAKSQFDLRRVATGDDSPAAVEQAVRDLDEVSVAVLFNVTGCPPPVREALLRLLRRGGGLLFLPGDVGPDGAVRFNETFGGVAPARLVRVTRPAGTYTRAGGVALDQVDFDHVVFRAFREPRAVNIATSKFAMYWELKDSQLAQVLARYEDGRPAFLERRLESGLTAMLTSPPLDPRRQPQWNDFALHAGTLVPLLQRTVEYLTARSERRTAYAVGDRIRIPPGRRLRDPRGDAHEGPKVMVAAQPGFYVLRERGDAERVTYAVNRDFAESDTTALNPKEVVSRFDTWTTAGETAQADLMKQEPEDEDEHRLWWYLLAALSLLGLAELFLANRTLRH